MYSPLNAQLIQAQQLELAGRRPGFVRLLLRGHLNY